MKTVYVGMSGGVDSSVSALLLKEQGYKVVGVYMKNWSRDLPGMKCPWAEDLADAKRVAVKLGIDFEVWDFEEAYREKVVEYMLSEFKKGNTPNPDIMCNQEIKFKLFYEKAMEAGADYIATGHYARVGRVLSEPVFSDAGLEFSSTSYAGQPAEPSLRDEPVGDVRNRRVEDSNHFMYPKKTDSDTRPQLLRAVDENKDQTYFLYRISEEALAHTIFPIGGMMKPEVKKLAAEHGLHNAYKKESMGVCFVGEVGMKDFLKEYIDTKPGEIREIETEKVLGYHEGVVFYTIGQRHGLYIAAEVPYYVVKKDVKNNIVYVSKNLNNAELWTRELNLNDVLLRRFEHDFSGTDRSRPSSRGERPHTSAAASGLPRKVCSQSPLQIQIRLRHRAPLIPAKFDGETLYFEHQIKRPASGQSAVFYDDQICLGGGVIV